MNNRDNNLTDRQIRDGKANYRLVSATRMDPQLKELRYWLKICKTKDRALFKRAIVVRVKQISDQINSK